jgi:hypothetical protein
MRGSVSQNVLAMAMMPANWANQLNAKNFQNKRPKRYSLSN